MMGKRIIYTLVIYVLGANLLFAQDLIKQANAEYEKDHYDKAIELYEKAAKQYGTSSELYYNIANSQYRLGNLGEAILNYERALKLDPSNDDARFNLDFVNEKANVKTDDGNSYFTDKFMNWIMCRSSNSWATVAVTLFLVFIVALLAYIFMSNIAIRKIGFFGGGIVLLMFLFSMWASFITRNRVVSSKYAIVIVPSSTLSTSPRQPKDKTEEAFLLNEGFKVAVIDSVKSEVMWYDVKTSDEHRAWIKASDVKII
ncbi:MAG: tetratricopeptide repeat protein [Muribaculaceae bacterium]